MKSDIAKYGLLVAVFALLLAACPGPFDGEKAPNLIINLVGADQAISQSPAARLSYPPVLGDGTEIGVELVLTRTGAADGTTYRFLGSQVIGMYVATGNYTIDLYLHYYDPKLHSSDNDGMSGPVFAQTAAPVPVTVVRGETIIVPVTVVKQFAVRAIEIAPGNPDVAKGGILQFTADVYFDDLAVIPDNLDGMPQDVAWSVTGAASTGTSISPGGLLTVADDETVGIDILTITARSKMDDSDPIDPAKLGTATVTVTVAPTDVTVAAVGNATTVLRGGAQLFEAEVIPLAASQIVTWTVTGGNSPGTSIDSDGLLSVAENETATTLTITATSTLPGVYGEATVTVTEPPPGVNVTPKVVNVVRGGAQQFNAEVIPSTASQDVTWEVTGGTSAGTVIDNDGLLTVDATETEGTTLTVTATSTLPSVYGGATVTVINPPTLEGGVSIAGALGGAFYVNSTLEADTTGLLGTGVLSYQWRWCDSDSPSAIRTEIPGATNATYTVTEAERGKYMNVLVTRTGYDGAADFSTANPIRNDGYAVYNSDQWNGFTGLAANSSWTIYVAESFSANANTTGGNTFGQASDVTIIGANNQISLGTTTNGSLLVVGAGQTVIMGNLKLAGKSSNNAVLVMVNGSLTMNSGEISGNKCSTANGGGVCVSGGSFLMEGSAVVSGNAAMNGGGVYITGSGAIFELNGGTIAGNTASSGGGGIAVVSDGSFSFNEGVVYGTNESDTTLRNTANTSGSAIHVSGGTASYASTNESISTGSSTIRASGGVKVE